MVPQTRWPARGWLLILAVIAIITVMCAALAVPSEAGAAKRYPGRQRATPTATAQPACVAVSEVDPLMEGVYRATVDGRRGLVRVVSRRAPQLIAGCWEAGQFYGWFSVEGK